MHATVCISAFAHPLKGLGAPRNASAGQEYCRLQPALPTRLFDSLEFRSGIPVLQNHHELVIIHP
jgi:hypothetical protein